MEDLPRGVLESILLKLPVELILRFRAVSKFWLEIIDDPSFRRSYKAEECMVLGYSWERKNWAPTIYSIVAGGRSVEAKEIVSAKGLKNCLFKNCCHGLFYFEKFDEGYQFRGVVFNPLTREVLKLPERPRWLRCCSIDQAIGFDPSTGTFKVVELFYNNSGTRSIDAVTFNLKTHHWRRHKGPRCPSHPVAPNCVHATDTGTLYWHIGSNHVYNSSIESPKRWPEGSCGQLIFSFDMGKEEFRSNWFPKRVYSMHITELNGRLTVCSYGVKYINLYELVDYQSQNWVRRYRIPKPPPNTLVGLSHFSMKKILVAYPLSNEEIQARQFYLYDLENSEWTNLGKGRFDLSIRVYCMKPYIDSLKRSDMRA